jgi:hypothetical protein
MANRICSHAADLLTAQVDSVRLAQVFVVELAFRHRQMVRLMMRAALQ